MPAILLALANFAPLLAKYLGGGPKTDAIAQAAVAVAQSVTGTSTPQEAIAKLQADTELVNKFKLAVMDKSIEWDQLYLKDTQDARDRDVKIRQAGQRNLRAEAMFLLAVVMVAVILYLVWTTPSITEFLKGIITLLLGRFLGYLDQIYNFEFGTTRSSRTKDETIKQLSQ